MTEGGYNNLLAIDTATAVLRLAVSFGSDRTVKSEEPNEFSHATVIMKKISDLLGTAEIEPGRLDGLIVNVGPGSFTGLRIGLAAAKGIAVVGETPMAGVSMFELAAARLPESPEAVNVVVPFKRDQVYVGTVVNGRCDVDKIQAVALTELADFLGTSPSTAVGFDLQQLASSMKASPAGAQLDYTAADLMAVGRSRLEKGQADEAASLEPLYLQKSQAEIKFEQRRQGRA
jgi:tRNA threonylcarbamoyladenosine biosynthesis protein TsaB